MQKFRYSIAIFLGTLLIGFLSAPAIIASIDESIDITAFFGISEEEESENLEIVIDSNLVTIAITVIAASKKNLSECTCDSYPNPSLNLFSPPPEKVKDLDTHF